MDLSGAQERYRSNLYLIVFMLFLFTKGFGLVKKRFGKWIARAGLNRCRLNGGAKGETAFAVEADR